MRIIEDVQKTSEVFPNLVLTIGSFDGVHLGHQRILEELIATARYCSGTAALLTLTPHPRQIFAPENAPNILTCDAKKAELLAQAGIDVLYMLPFDAAIAAFSPREFVEEIVVKRCHAKVLIVGHDFCFGKNAEGDYEYLSRIAPDYGFSVRQIAQRVIQGERVSSTLIRECILQGEVERVEHFLGRKYSIRGTVESGRGVGRKLGFPTANLRPHCDAIPANGVYAAEAWLEGVSYPAAINIGVAPTIRHNSTAIEAHLLDFEKQDIVGEVMEVVFHKRIRPEKKFESLEALIEAIDRDVEAIRAYFKQNAS